MSNLQASTSDAIEQFLASLTEAAQRRKLTKGVEYRKGKEWADDRILEWLKAETSDEQEIRPTGDEDMRVSDSQIGESSTQQEIPQTMPEAVQFSAQEVESVEQQVTSQKPAEPMSIVMTGTDGGTRGIVLDRAHLFTSNRQNGFIGVKNRVEKSGESVEQKEIRQKKQDLARVSPENSESLSAQSIRQTGDEDMRVSDSLSGESHVWSDNRPIAHEPMRVSPVTYSFRFTPPNSSVQHENGESLSDQAARQKPDGTQRVSDSLDGESSKQTDIRHSPTDPVRVSPENGESLSEQAIRQSLNDTMRVSESLSGESRKQKEIRQTGGWDFAPLPYWVVAGACTTWLVHSMAQGLGGGLWNYCIAAAFDITPVLLVGARVSDPRTQQTAMIGAVLIFLAGLSLYLAPHVQTLSNELTVYGDKSSRYESDLKEYEDKSKNKQELIDEAKKKYDDADADYKSKLDAYGQGNWRTGVAKQKSDKLYSDWKNQSKEGEAIVKPEAPVYTDNLRTAAQELIMRLGLFAACFLLMFVMRRLDPKPAAD